MEIVPWTDKRAVRFNQANADYILSRIPYQPEYFNAMMQDVERNKIPYYIVAWRDWADGHPHWIVLDEASFIDEYNIIFTGDRYQNHFDKI